MIRKNKKGISPLIATVLIIAFTIAVAVIIMSWGTRFVRETTETTSEKTEEELACATSLNFDVSATSSEDGSDAFSLTIDNKGETKITKAIVRVYNTTGSVFPTEITQEKPATGQMPLPAFGASTYSLSTEGNLKNVDKVEVIAVIEKDGAVITCSNSVAKADILTQTV